MIFVVLFCIFCSFLCFKVAGRCPDLPTACAGRCLLGQPPIAASMAPRGSYMPPACSQGRRRAPRPRTPPLGCPPALFRALAARRTVRPEDLLTARTGGLPDGSPHAVLLDDGTQTPPPHANDQAASTAHWPRRAPYRSPRILSRCGASEGPASMGPRHPSSTGYPW